MKYIKIALGLAFAAGLMAVAASPALALSPRWVTCQNVGTGGHWTDSHCEKAGAGEWDTREVTETREVTSSSSKIELEDTAVLLGPSSVECEGTDTGTIGAGGTDSTVGITVTKCKIVRAGPCEKLEEVKPLNLPWLTLLEERENKGKEREVRDRITSLVVGKNPGWAVKCKTIGGVKTDECTGITSTGVRNGAGGVVEGIFEKISEETPASCTEGNSKSGFVRGTTINRLRNAKGELQPFWVLAAAFKT